jgi:hypothetical protein
MGAKPKRKGGVEGHRCSERARGKELLNGERRLGVAVHNVSMPSTMASVVFSTMPRSFYSADLDVH